MRLYEGATWDHVVPVAAAISSLTLSYSGDGKIAI